MTTAYLKPTTYAAAVLVRLSQGSADTATVRRWLVHRLGASPESRYISATRNHLKKLGLIRWEGWGAPLELTDEGKREAARIIGSWQSMLSGPMGAR